MAHDTQRDKRKFIEFNNLFVDYTEGDVVILDNVMDLVHLHPPKQNSSMIVFCRGGNAKIQASNSNVEMGKGDVLFCPTQTDITGCQSNADFTCNVLCLADHIIQGLLHDKADIWHRAVYTNKLNLIHLTDAGQEEFGYYYALIQSKTRLREQQAPYEILQALIRALLLDLCYQLDGANVMVSEQKLSQGKMLFNKFLKLVSGNDVKRQPITQYASQLAITPKYLTMLCLKYSDKTASDWVIQYTTEDIRFYLRNSNLSIKEISAKLGFANMSHFGSYVRKHLGVSPSEFRDKL